MTILYCGFADLSANKGDAVHALELTANLRKLGDRVIVVARSGKPISSLDFFCAGGRQRGGLSAVNLLIFALSLLRAGRLVLSLAPGCDVIYARDYLSCSIGIIAKMLYSKRMIWEVNGIAALEREQKPHPLNLLLLPVINALERLAGMSADRIAPVSKGIMDALLARGYESTKLTLVENGVNLDMFAVDPEEDLMGEEKRGLGLPPDVPVVCYAGAIRPWQGLGVLVTAAREMRRQDRDVRFLVVGGGEGLEALKKEAEVEGVSSLFRFVGPVPYDRVPIFLALADICVAPFKAGRAASPIKIYEYMASRKPLVSSRIAGLEFIEDLGLGHLVDPDDASALAASLIGLVDDPQGAVKMGTRAREYAVENCSWLSVARRAKALCEGAVAA